MEDVLDLYAEAAQRRPRSHQLDVHNRKGPRQNGPHLSEARGRVRPSAKSQNLCDEVLVRFSGEGTNK
jgi:hypothetical protein